MLIVGAVLIALALVPVGFFLYFRRRLQAMTGTDTYTVAELENLRASMGVNVGDGLFARAVEIKGQSNTPEPLTSPQSQTKCVIYRARVIRESERDEWDTDSRGNRRRRRVRSSDTVSQDEQFADLFVSDLTGEIPVLARGANIDYIKAAEEYQPATDGMSSVTFGGMRFGLSAMMGTDRVLGYRYIEEVIPVNQHLYVLGEAADVDGRLVIRKPVMENLPFIISHRSEEELQASARKRILFSQIAAVALVVVGVVVVVLAL